MAQRHVAPSTVPVIEGDELRPRPVVLRTFVVADGSEGYQAMPGALGLVGGVGEADISIARGARSKDTWVISDGAVSEFTLLRPTVEPVELTRGGGDLPSRVADNFFWLGRYAERAEAIARLGRIICSRLAEPRDPQSLAGDLAPLVASLRALTMVASGTELAALPPLAEVAESNRIMREALFDEALSGSLIASGRAIDRVARAIRDRLSMDTWTVVSALAHELADAERGRRRRASDRSGRAARSGGHDPGRALGLDLREHDARGALAVPRHGAAPRARPQHRAHDRADAPRAPRPTTSCRSWRRCSTRPTAR